MELEKINTKIRSGDERLTYNNEALEFSLLDFWRWSVSDILSNATRGKLAEFIVASAVEIDKTVVRDEWSAYDLETPDGIKLEIKSSAYLQSWFQKEYSTIQFSTKLARYWDSSTNQLSTEKKRHADVYVFCLLHQKDKKTVDPLNLNQWEFYILSTTELNAYTRSQHSITLNSLKNKDCGPISYDKLYDVIKEKHKLNSK